MALHCADNAPIGPEAPSYVVHSMAPIPSHEVTSCRIKISDFSSAVIVGHESKYASTTLPVTPPEALFDEELTFSMDIWSLGCTLFDVVGDGPLLSAFGDEDYAL
ncbi:hypothetical protein MMC31_001032 [Peltigera leucophlebia]|nr:hypothetical protein [Peltigera leucophlebia]